jgi:hypothetical protein
VIKLSFQFCKDLYDYNESKNPVTTQRKFVPRNDLFSVIEKSTSGTSAVTDEQRKKDNQAFMYVHAILKPVSDIVPL